MLQTLSIYFRYYFRLTSRSILLYNESSRVVGDSHGGKKNSGMMGRNCDWHLQLGDIKEMCKFESG